MVNRFAKPVMLLGALSAILGLTLTASCSGSSKNSGAGEVILFTSLDKLFSEPIARAFEQKTGIRVKLETDSEAAKTVGLVNRLIARKEHPEADVFWNNELAQTFVLKEQDVITPYKPAAAEGIPARFKDADGWWTGFAARARVILYNTELVKAGEEPKTLDDLLLPRFKGSVVIAKPLFGTTLSHAAALFATRGEEKAKSFFTALKANGVTITAGNAMARKLVAEGEMAVCLTDTDDAHEALLKKRPVEMVFPDAAGAGTLVIPNSVSLIRGGPNPDNAKKLIEFLLSPEVEALLAKSESAQMPVRPGIPSADERFRLDAIKAMEVDWTQVAKQLPAVKTFVETELKW